VTREGEAEIFARGRLEGAGIKKERTSREAFSIGKISQARELSPHGNRARERGGESSS
jgi:hypothetical protein